jgi:O-antigen/teichoic acid export membrane protein
MGGQKVFVLTLLAAILSFTAPYGLNLFLAQTFTPEEFGEISAILSISGFLAGFILLGSDQSCIKFIPQYLAEGNYSKLHGLHKFYWRYVILLCLFLLIAGLGVSSLVWGFHQTLSGFEINILWEYLWLIPLAALLSFFTMILCALRKPVDSTLTYYVFPSLFLVVGLIFWKNIFDTLEIRTAIFLYGFAVLCVVIYQIVKIKKALHPQIFRSPPENHNRVWLVTGVQLLFILLVTWEEGLVNFLFKLTRQDSGDSLAIFNAVATIADFMWISYYTCRVLLDSTIAPTALLSGTSKFQRLINKGNIVMFSFGVLFLVVFIFFGKTLLSHFGPTYIAGYPALLLIATGYLFSLCAGLSCDIMEYAVEPRIFMLVNALGFIAICFLGFFLIYFWGLYGGVVTLILVETGSTLVYATIIRKTLKVNVFGIY